MVLDLLGFKNLVGLFFKIHFTVCVGNIVFVSIGILLVLFFIEGKVSFYLDKYYVFIFETIAVIAFGISWLVKGKMINDVMTMFEK